MGSLESLASPFTEKGRQIGCSLLHIVWYGVFQTGTPQVYRHVGVLAVACTKHPNNPRMFLYG